MDIKKIKNPPNKYRPMPFWSWNEKLNTEETARQVELMHEAGLGGFFMHARGGLLTEYMGDEWFENIAEGVKCGKNHGMSAWAYDENGWPSGFGDGLVNGLGKDYQQKFLRMEQGEKNTDCTIYNADGIHFYYEVNPFYVDNLDKKVVREFIEKIYQPYYDKFGNGICGFFTDEPEIAFSGIPWSFVLPEKYEKEYGDDLLPRLIELFKPVGEYKETRKRFWRLVTKLFSESFFAQIYRWCDERGLKLTGHLVSETTMKGQLTSNGACMPHYEYFHIPGMDWLGRNPGRPPICLQVASAAAQTGKKQILSESYALSGHGVSFSELRRILEWQMVRGVNLLCPHLQGYSLRGIRKRDYPPALYYQQPWWDEYKLFTDSMSRIGMLVAEGKNVCDTLLIHPQTSAWICFDSGENEGLVDLNLSFMDTIAHLEKKHIQFHLGDETLMERHGSVKGNKLVIGQMEYSTVVLPEYIDLFDNTKALLDEFKANGGKIVKADEVKPNNVIDNEDVTYLKRCFDDFDMHYFVNTTEKLQNSYINVDGDKLDIMTGDIVSMSKNHTFQPMDSLVVIEYKGKKGMAFEEKALDTLSISGDWSIKGAIENAMTLDFCDCYFDGALAGKHISVIAAQEMACQLKRPVSVKLVFNVNVNHIPDDMCLVCETPHIFEYKINGKEFSFCDEGYFRDSSFRKANVAQYMVEGENKIELSCNFSQSAQVYHNIDNIEHPVVRNNFTYDMELESIYLTGSFGVLTEGEFEPLENNAVRFIGDMKIGRLPSCVTLANIEQQGFAFFAGRMTVEKTFELKDTNYKLNLAMKGLNAVKVKVNGIDADTIIWNRCELNISEYLKEGANTIELTLVNNLRNLLGPHHLDEGESYTVRPASFFGGKSLWNRGGGKEFGWSDNYCFIETSLI